jgi:hypothetical protein
MIRIFFLLITSTLLFGCASLPPQINILGTYKVEGRTCRGSDVQVQTCQKIRLLELVKGNFYKISDNEVAFVIWSGDKNKDLLYSAKKYNAQLIVNSFPTLLPLSEDTNFIESITLNSEDTGVYRFGSKSASDISELKFTRVNTGPVNTKLEDADAFCNVHALDNWKDLKPDISISEFNTQVKAKVKSVLKTREFLSLLDDMDSIDFYHEMYPAAKAKIESLTGSTWDCPAYQNFYNLKSLPDNLEQSKTLEPQIVVNASDQYLLQGEPLNLNTDELKTFIHSRSKDKLESPIVILLKAGATDMGLQRLFEALTSLQVTNVSVISEE